MAAHSLNEEQQRELDAQLHYLEEASTRVGRLDWKNLLLGAFLTQVAYGVLPGSVVRDALVIAGHVLGHLFGVGPAPLPPAT